MIIQLGFFACHTILLIVYALQTVLFLAKSCSNPSPIPNGFIKGTLYTYDKYVTYGCNVGYRLRGLSWRRCLENEKWSGSSPICESMFKFILSQNKAEYLKHYLT